ncbi:MAG TPA: GAF domain-containing protein [Opitutaceae bacterium]|nr:GAF domain-containing protein [Opitutaceae bacterium]HND61144.1 GAF domain-containing protein [Opitutaceae bacterium]
MPSLVILATADAALADAWERQLPAGRSALRLTPQTFSAGTAPGFAAVVVLDAAAEAMVPTALVRCPTIYVGEPRSLPFEQARLAGRARLYLSYEESTERLRELLPLVEEVAEKQSMVELLTEKTRRLEPSRPASRAAAAADAADLWDFLEGAVENLDTRDRLIAEFRRASRHVLRASHAVFFLREADGFRADRGTSFFPADDPLVALLETRPAVIDGANWEGPADPVAELAVRNRLALWGARLLVPIHDNGRLLGLIALGVRDDGEHYDEADRSRAVFFARLLRHFLSRAAQLARLTQLAEQARLGSKYLPSTLVLAADEAAPRTVPLIVRDLIGQARRTRQVCRAAPTEAQPFRASAGVVAETGGIWAFWEEASGEVHDAAVRDRASRHHLLRELALTLNHELGNALVSLATFRHSTPEQPLTAPLLETVKSDIAKLEALNKHVGMMHALQEAEVAAIDMRELAQSIGYALGLRVEVGPEPVVLEVSRRLLDFALRSLISTITENRGELGARELSLQVRSTGEGADLTALFSIKGRQLELEGIIPEPVEGAVPNQGRLGVFLAKEILRLHRGEIHAGPGMEGTEILLSLRKW